MKIDQEANFIPAYTRRLDIVQRGYAGYNSDWAKKILPKIIENEHRPDSKILLGTIFFGTNDSVLGGPQIVPLERYIENSRYFLQLFKANDIKPILIGVAKHDHDKWAPSREADIAMGILRTNENNQRYSEALKALAAEENVPFVDLYTLFDTYPGDWKNLLLDGVHYTGEGYRILFEELMKVIREWYPQYHPENLDYILQYWRDVKPSDFQ